MRKEFQRVTPEEVGLSSQGILQYLEDLESSQTEMHGIMIMRHGKVCAEGWWSPFAPNLRHGLQSLTKTYAATAVGIAVTRGELSLDERVIDIFPEYAPDHPSDNLKLLRVRDVLCMGCGMESMPPNTKDWIRDFLSIPVVHKPGTAYMYNSTGSTLLGAMVRQKTGLGLHDYLKPRLFDKIGINADNLRWLYMADGMEIGGGGLYATTEDNLRLMKLYADGGVWEGERILSQEYVRLATSVQNESASEARHNPDAADNFLGYGYQIWMCKPRGVYRADGAMGQFSIVCPEQDLIIAINETARGAHWAQNTLDITWKFLESINKPVEAECEGAPARLRKKMAGLRLPLAHYMPFSDTSHQISGKTYRVEEGKLSLELFNFMSPQETKAARAFRFDFDDYGCLLTLDFEGGAQEVRVATNGGSSCNRMGQARDAVQLLVCDGAWVEGSVFQMRARWVETCFYKEFRFAFDGGRVTVEASMSGMMPRGPAKPEVITAGIQ